MAPDKVAGLMEFQVLETEPEMERTYCIVAAVRRLRGVEGVYVRLYDGRSWVYSIGKEVELISR